MKLLRKINKGFILTVIVLLILIIYLISIESKRNIDKPAIEEACRDYIAFVCDYATMPKDIQKVYNSEEISPQEKKQIEENVKNKIDSQMDKLEDELKKKMIQNELAVSMQKDAVEASLTNNNDVFESIIINNNHNIKKIKKFTFDDNQVIATFVSDVEQEKKYLNGEGKEVSNINKFETYEESITLQKVSDEWKVVYADIQYNDYSSSSMVQIAY